MTSKGRRPSPKNSRAERAGALRRSLPRRSSRRALRVIGADPDRALFTRAALETACADPSAKRATPQERRRPHKSHLQYVCVLRSQTAVNCAYRRTRTRGPSACSLMPRVFPLRASASACPNRSSRPKRSSIRHRARSGSAETTCPVSSRRSETEATSKGDSATARAGRHVQRDAGCGQFGVPSTM